MSDQRDPVDRVRRLDPIEGARVAAEWSTSDAKSALFQEITAMPAESRPHSSTTFRRSTPRHGALVAATLAVAALAIAVIGGLPQTASSAYAVRQLPDGVLEVSWDGELDGDVLAATLREYDLDVQVETEPASLSLVGQVSGLGPLEQQDAAAFEWGEGASTFTLDPPPSPAPSTSSSSEPLSRENDTPRPPMPSRQARSSTDFTAPSSARCAATPWPHTWTGSDSGRSGTS
jgi:hypothetical protein